MTGYKKISLKNCEKAKTNSTQHYRHWKEPHKTKTVNNQARILTEPKLAKILKRSGKKTKTK